MTKTLFCHPERSEGSLRNLFTLSRPDMLKIIGDFHREMDKGLAGKASSLKMISTYAPMPTGREKGNFLAIDLGGTNFRVLKIALSGGKAGNAKIMKFAIKKSRMTTGAGDFFDFIADSVRKFLKKYRLVGAPAMDMGFTFSFPVRQTGIDSGILICWTKGFEIRGAVGKDVVELMRGAFARRGVSNIRIAALVNDTVGTLAARRYEDSACDIGVIIGTGTNACYFDALSARGVINIEWGNFNKLKPTFFDRRLDEESDNPGQQILEKMVSGMYLGKIVGLICDRKDIGTEDMSRIESRPGGGELKQVCAFVSRRAARISASCIAAIVIRIDPRVSRRHTIAIDGSLFEKHPTFSGNMRRALREILGSKARLIKLTLTKDGSGKGAAIIAASSH